MSGTLAENFEEFWRGKANSYQLTLLASRQEPSRYLLVERQRGTTYGIVAEAILAALETGNAQVFVAPSTEQALICKAYAQQLRDEFTASTPVELLTAPVRDVVKCFRYASPRRLKKVIEGAEAINLYVSDWLFMTETEVEVMRTFVRQHSPTRNTWVSSVPETPRMQVLLGATRLT